MQSTEARTVPRLDRLDRHVGRGLVRIHGRASSHRIAYSLEQALRLSQLPGESEGRLYCFRRVMLTGVPVQADLKVWTESVQRHLGNLAAQAVLGTTPGARGAEAIYFHSIQQAMETLLRQAVQSATHPAWFSSSILGISPDSNRAAQIQAIIECLRQPPIPPGAAPQIVLAALGDSDPVPLLSAIPIETIRVWLRELDSTKKFFGELPALKLDAQCQSALHRAAREFGWRDPHVLWLCCLALLGHSPSFPVGGTTVNHARSILRQLEEADSTPHTINAKLPGEESAADQGNESGRALRPLLFDEDRQETRPVVVQQLRSLEERSQNQEEIPCGSLDRDQSEAQSNLAIAGELASADIPAEPNYAAFSEMIGEPTQAAGLYFLLAGLRHLGIAAAVERCPALQPAGFPEHLLCNLAARCHVAVNDPCLAYLRTAPAEFAIDASLLKAVEDNSALRPTNLSPSLCLILDSSTLIRLWTVALRRWCWRMGRLTAEDIILRPGRVWISRGELDITLPLAAADVRVRRLGLDIDPGWLPWFGAFGTVVRFHYRDWQPGGREQ